MTDRSHPEKASALGHRGCARFGGSLLVAALLTSCALPFTDGGEDISAEVDVAGAEADSTIVEDVGGDEQELSSTTDTPTEEPTPSIATKPVEIDDRFNGRSVQYLGIGIELGDLVTTAQTAEEYLRSEPASDSKRRLLIEVAVTNQSNGTVALPRSVLGIRLASGERIAADEMLALVGDRVDTVRPEAQSTERTLLTFADVDLTGASFEITEASTIPVRIPLDPAIPVAAPYSLALPGQPPVANLGSPSAWPACEYAWTGEVVDARIMLEGIDGTQRQRAFKGARWVAVDLLVTNDTTDSEDFYPCNQLPMPMTNVSPRLQIDGVATTETNRVPIGDDIEMGEMAAIQFWYRIESDTDLIELTDTDGTRIAAWQLDLPTVDGED